MPYIPATEIGAVFLLAVVLIGLSKIREAYPDLPQSIKPLLYVCAGLLLAGAGYQMLPDLYRHMFGGGSASVNTTATAPSAGAASSGGSSGSPQPKKATVTEIEYTLTEGPKPAASVAAVQPAQENLVEPKPAEPAVAAEPAAASTDTASATPESRGKKVIKSIGHVFHIGRHKDKDQDGE